MRSASAHSVDDKDASGRGDAVVEALARINELAARMSETLHRGEVAKLLVENAREIIGADHATVMVPTETGDALQLLGHHGLPDDAVQLLLRLPLDSDLLMAGVFREGRPFVALTADECDGRYPMTSSKDWNKQLSAIASIPLLQGSRVLGSMTFSFLKDVPLHDALEAILTNLARHTASALERAGLYEAERKARSDAEHAVAALSAERAARTAAERIQLHLERLNELTTESTGALTREDVARVVVRRTLQMLKADQAVLLLREDDGSLRVLDHQNVAEPTLAMFKNLSVDADHPLAAALRTSQPQLFETRESILNAYPDFQTTPEVLERLQGIAIFPLLAATRRVGALGFTFFTPTVFDDGFKKFVAELAERSALALERASLYEAEKAAVRAREEFLAVAAHELRTPLTPITLKLQTLSRELGTEVPPERLRDHVDTMMRQLRKLTQLVNGLLDVTRISAGKLTLERREVNIAELVREVVVRHEPEAATAGCTVYMDVPEQVLGEFDPMRVEQVTTNLLSNALKYGAGHPIRVSLNETTRNIQLVVDDEGVGIDPADLPRLFGRFERAASGMTFSGLGLGLFITRQIVEAHGGLIRVESAPGQGSRFEVELPKISAAEAAKPRGDSVA